MLRAEDFDAAQERALALGHAHEREYRNDDGHLVQWRFKEIISLDIILTDDLDGAEVYSEPLHLSGDDVIPFETEFRPQESDPIQTM